MNPLLIVIVVIGGVMVMGVLGALLALPIAAALQVLLHQVQQQRTRQWEQEGHERAPTPAAPPLEDTEEAVHHH
jgi:predicted PurR-regulated permease PerM